MDAMEISPHITLQNRGLSKAGTAKTRLSSAMMQIDSDQQFKTYFHFHIHIYCQSKYPHRCKVSPHPEPVSLPSKTDFVMSFLRRLPRTPFDIPELTTRALTKIIENATSGLSPEVSSEFQGQLTELGFSVRNAAMVVAGLLRLCDELGSHTPPVYKSLYLMVVFLHSTNSQYFKTAMKALLPEIETLCYLSFGTAEAPYRDRIHHMADAIYRSIAHDIVLPDAEAFGSRWRSISAVAAEAANSSAAVDVKESERSALALSAKKRLSGFEQFSRVELADVHDEELDLESNPPRTAQDLIGLVKPKLITRVRYDEEFESC
jgi:hypothetical protein